MNFLDKLQEAIYDVIGYIFPGLLTIFILTPSILLYKDKGEVVLPTEILANSTNIEKLKVIINMDFSTTKGIFILISAWLLGHLIRFLAISFYKIVFSIENNVLKVNTRKSKIENELINKSVEIYKKNFKDAQIESYDDEKKERILASCGRAQIRMYNVSSLVQKYISKYNLYCSLGFISFIVYLNVFIIFFSRYTIWFKLSNLLAILAQVCLVKILKSLKGENAESENKFCLKIINHVGTFSASMCFLMIPIVIFTVKYKITSVHWMFCCISILLYITFDNEYRRHYLLHVKESLFGIIYVDDNEEKKYYIKYNKGN